jgi:hypothetical protein
MTTEKGEIESNQEQSMHRRISLALYCATAKMTSCSATVFDSARPLPAQQRSHTHVEVNVNDLHQ